MVGAGNVDILDATVLKPVRVGAATARDLANQAARITDAIVRSGGIADDGALGIASGINAHVAYRNNASIGASDHTAGAHVLIGVRPGGEYIYPRDDCRARCDGFRDANFGVHRYVTGGITEHAAHVGCCTRGGYGRVFANSLLVYPCGRGCPHAARRGDRTHIAANVLLARDAKASV